MLIYLLSTLLSASSTFAVPIHQAQEADVQRLIRQGAINSSTNLDFSQEKIFRDSTGKAWQIQKVTAPGGEAPVFFIPHDDEQDSFRSGIEYLKKHGRGTIVMLDCGERRICGDHDPNRYFCNASYREKIFSYFKDQKIVMTLHNNANGCDRNGGSGSIHVDFPYTGAQGFAWGRGGRYGDGDDVLIHNGKQPPDGFNARLRGFLQQNKVNELYETNARKNDCSMSFAATAKRMDYLNFDMKDRQQQSDGYKIQFEVVDKFNSWYRSAARAAPSGNSGTKETAIPRTKRVD